MSIDREEQNTATQLLPEGVKVFPRRKTLRTTWHGRFLVVKELFCCFGNGVFSILLFWCRNKAFWGLFGPICL